MKGIAALKLENKGKPVLRVVIYHVPQIYTPLTKMVLLGAISFIIAYLAVVMNLVVDVGNTNIKLGVFAKNELKEVSFNGNDLQVLLGKYKIKHALLAKTGKNDEIQHILEEHKIAVMPLSHQLKFPLQILYKTPETLGADRIAGSVAAHALFTGHNVLKIDFGTCITYDFIDNGGQYLGGGIAPGMMMRFKAMHNYTAKLPLIDPMQHTNFELIGDNTENALLSGVMNGIKNEVAGIINEYDERFGSLKVVATGGDSGLFVTLLKNEIFARPYLVLEGLNTILNYNI